ncbi:MAG: ATP-binding protein [Actinomycetes bacterium]
MTERPGRGSRSLVQRIVVTFMLLSSLMVGLVAAVAYVRAKDELQAAERTRLASVQVLAVDALGRWLDEQRRNVQFVSGLLGGVEREGTLPGVRGRIAVLFSDEATDAQRARAARVVSRTLTYAVGQSSDAQELLVIDPEGRVLISTVPSHVGVDLSAELGDDAVAGARVLPLGTTALGGGATVVLTTPLYDSSGRARATLAATLDVRRIDQTVLARTGLGDGGRTYLVASDDGRVFARGPARPVSSLAIEQGLAGRDGQATYDDYTGTSVIGSWTWVPSIQAALVSEVPTSAAFAPAAELARWIAAIGAVVVAVLAGLTLLAARRIARPVLAITDAAAAVRAGDLDRVAPVLTRDEVGSLAVAFNEMTGQLRRNVQELEQRVRERTHELSTQKRYFETLVEISPAAVVTMDTELRVTGWNPAAEKLFGYGTGEAVGRLVDELVLTSESMRGEGQEAAREALERGRGYRVTQRARKDGSLVDVEIVLVPLTVDGRHVGFYAVYHDVTELNEARLEADRANAAKSAFLAAMSHEIRTPLNAIIGLGRLLHESELTPEQADFAGSIAASGEALLAVINDVLDLSKIEAGRMELVLDEVDPAEVVEEAVELLGSATDWRTGVVLDVAGDVPARVIADGTRLRQVVLNLVGNAVKFTEGGRVTVAVRADGPATAGATARLSVSVTDTGAGVTPEQQERLFESFVQASAQTQRRHGGTGLGLAISRRLAELMGGTLTLTSPVSDGRGSRFELDVPVEVVAPAREPRLDSLAGRPVHVVHHDPVAEEVLARRLREAGADVSTGGAADGSGPHDARVVVLDALLRGAEEVVAEEDPVATVLVSRVPRWRSVELLGWAPPPSVPWLTEPVRTRSLIRATLTALGGPAQASRDVGGPREAAPLPPLRVLVAEDNAVNRKLVVVLLARAGIVPDVVEDGAAAVAAVAETRYDVALLDLRMPVMGGLEAATAILARATPGAHVPVLVALTADVGEADRRAARAAGITEFLAKPLREEELRAVLARVPAAEAAPATTSAPRASATSATSAAMVRLTTLAGDDEDLARELVATFVEDVPGLVAELDEALAVASAADLRRVAHTLKSHGALLGEAPLEQHAREVEAMATEGRLEDAVGAVSQLRLTAVEAAGRWDEGGT